MITAISPSLYAAKGVSFTGIQKSQVKKQNQSEEVKNNPSFGDFNDYMHHLKNIGAILLSLAFFLGVGYYIYEQAFVPHSAGPGM